MLLLRQLGPDALRRELERQRAEEMQGLDYGEDPNAIAGQIRRQSGNPLVRKAAASARLLVDAQRHRHLIEAHVLAHYKDETIREEILAHVNTLKNLQRKVTNRVAVAYHRPPARTLEGVDEGQAKRLLSAYRRAGTDIKAEQWNRQAFFLSVVHVIPRIEDGELTWVTVLPNVADVLFDAAGEREPSILVFEAKSNGAKYIAVDSERWWWLSEGWEVLIEEEHRMGMRPWWAIRWEDNPDGDYWNRGAGQDLFDGTMEVARVYAQMRWTRKHWSKRLMSLHLGENVEAPENQNLGSNQPVQFRGDGQANLQVHDTVVPVGHFIEEMREIENSVYEAYGLEEGESGRSERSRHGHLRGQADPCSCAAARRSPFSSSSRDAANDMRT